MCEPALVQGLISMGLVMCEPALVQGLISMGLVMGFVTSVSQHWLSIWFPWI